MLPPRHPKLQKTVLLLLLLPGLPGGLQGASPGAMWQDEARKSEKKPQGDRFLVFGTVFTERGFSLPGAKIEIRRAGEIKVRWRARSDRRGEFALRVPGGAEYMVRVTARGYEDQQAEVDARQGGRAALVFPMKPQPEGGKP